MRQRDQKRQEKSETDRKGDAESETKGQFTQDQKRQGKSETESDR